MNVSVHSRYRILGTAGSLIASVLWAWMLLHSRPRPIGWPTFRRALRLTAASGRTCRASPWSRAATTLDLMSIFAVPSPRPCWYAGKVRFITVANVNELASEHDVDLAVRRLTWTPRREAANGMAFGPITFYDGQGFLVSKDGEIKSAAQLATNAYALSTWSITPKP